MKSVKFPASPLQKKGASNLPDPVRLTKAEIDALRQGKKAISAWVQEEFRTSLRERIEGLKNRSGNTR